MTDEQCIRIVILKFLRNIASDVQNERLQCTNLPINLLPTNYLQPVELKYENIFVL